MNKKGGSFWTKEEEKELLKSHNGGELSETARRFALKSGRTVNSVRIKLTKLIEEMNIHVPQSRHPDWDKPISVIGDALVMGDLHIPYHDAEHINKCLEVSRKAGVRKLILGGDVLDARAFSHWPEDFDDENKYIASENLYRKLMRFAESLDDGSREEMYDLLAATQPPTGSIGEEIGVARDVLNVLSSQFDEIYWVMGNHEGWVVRMLQKTLTSADFSRLFLDENPKWRVTEYYWCSLISNGVKYQIEHPKNSTKGSSKRLVPIYQQNIIMFHNHHFSVQTDPSGMYLAIEPGMCADPKKIQYDNQRHSAHDAHVTGAVLVRNGKVHLLNGFSDWELLLRNE